MRTYVRMRERRWNRAMDGTGELAGRERLVAIPAWPNAELVAAHDAQVRCRGGSVDRAERQRFANQRLDVDALIASEVAEQAVLVGREAHRESSDIGISHIAHRMWLASRGQTHGPGNTRLPCF